MNTFSNLEARVLYDQLQQVLQNQKQIISMLQKQQQSVNSYGSQINDDQIRKAILDINPNIVSNRDGFNSACKQYSSWWDKFLNKMTTIQLLLQHYNQVLKELNLKQTDSLETALQTLLTNDKFNKEQSLQDLNLILTNNLRDEEERKRILNQVEELYDSNNLNNLNYFLQQFSEETESETQKENNQKSLLTLVLTILLLIIIFIIGLILLIIKVLRQNKK